MTLTSSCEKCGSSSVVTTESGVKCASCERKPHGRDCPDRCSMCLGADVKRVAQAGPELFVDGVLERSIAPDIEPNAHQPRQQRRNRGRK